MQNCIVLFPLQLCHTAFYFSYWSVNIWINVNKMAIELSTFPVHWHQKLRELEHVPLRLPFFQLTSKPHKVYRVGQKSKPLLISRGLLFRPPCIIQPTLWLSGLRFESILFHSFAKRIQIGSFWRKVETSIQSHLYSLGGATVFSSHQRHLPPSVSQSLVELTWVQFTTLTSVCEAWQWSIMQNLRSWVKTTVQFWAVCGPNFMTFWDM